MKKGSILVSLLMVASLFFTSCDDDSKEVEKKLTISEAKTSLSNMSSDMETDVVDLVQSEGIDAASDLFRLLDINDPFGGRVASEKKWIGRKARLFKTIFVPSKSVPLSGRTQEDGFDFQANWGVYNWNPVTEVFDKSDEQVQMVVINFPEEGSQTNNVALRITDYAEIAIIDGIDTNYHPTKLSADLSVDGTEQISIALTMAYNEVGDPISGDINLFVNPYSMIVKFDDTAANQSSLSASLTKGTKNVFSTDFNVSFDGTDKEEVNKAVGFVQYYQMKIQGTIDAKGIEGVDGTGINGFVDLEVFDGNSKVGDVIFVVEVVDGSEEDVPYVEYADGSKEKLEDILQPVIDRLEGEFEDWDLG